MHWLPAVYQTKLKTQSVRVLANRGTMRKFASLIAFSVGLCLAITSAAAPAEDWQCTTPPVEACFKAHGRLSSQNGIAYMIWLIGTKRIVAVQDTQISSLA